MAIFISHLFSQDENSNVVIYLSTNFVLKFYESFLRIFLNHSTIHPHNISVLNPICHHIELKVYLHYSAWHSYWVTFFFSRNLSKRNSEQLLSDRAIVYFTFCFWPLQSCTTEKKHFPYKPPTPPTTDSLLCSIDVLIVNFSCNPSTSPL